MKRILITGASGFLGGHLCQQAQQAWEVIGTCHSSRTVPAGVQTVQMNLANQSELANILDEANACLIIHAAVLQVDACERDPRLAYLVNIQATDTIAHWCARHERRLVYVSSDLVFDGRRGWYKESDAPQPVMRYGENKLCAEQTALEVCPNTCIARLALMYGHAAAGVQAGLSPGNNFFMSMIQSLQRGEKVRVFSDQYRTPGLVANMAEAVLELAESDFKGTIHIAGTQRCSRKEMARSVCRLLGYNENLLEPVSMFEIKMPAPRPADVSLDCSLAREILKTKLMGYEEGLPGLLNTTI
ncbi:MAG: SDR family oxidoreductase [bacterium]